MRIRKMFTFEAAHRLPFHNGKCFDLHGHSYRLEVTLRGAIKGSGSETGMVSDFSNLSSLVKEYIVQRLDHKLLNDIIENPTCELMLIWIARSLIPHLPQLDQIVLWETATSSAILARDDLDLFID